MVSSGQQLHTLLLSIYLSSRAKLWCVLQLRGQIQYTTHNSPLPLSPLWLILLQLRLGVAMTAAVIAALLLLLLLWWRRLFAAVPCSWRRSVEGISCLNSWLFSAATRQFLPLQQLWRKLLSSLPSLPYRIEWVGTFEDIKNMNLSCPEKASLLYCSICDFYCRGQQIGQRYVNITGVLDDWCSLFIVKTLCKRRYYSIWPVFV